MKKSFTEILTVELAKLLSPLLLLETKEDIQELLAELGWEVDLSQIDPNDFVDIVTEVGNLLGEIGRLPDAADNDEKLEILKDIGIQAGVVVTMVNDLIPDIEAIVQTATSGTTVDQLKKLPRRLGDYLIYTYLEEYYKPVFAVKHLLGMAEIVEDDAGKPIKTIQWPRIPKIFYKPIEVFDEVYDWSSDFKDNKFLERFEKLVTALGLPGGIYEQTATIQAHLQNPSGTKEIRMPLYQDGVWPDNWRELDLNISPVPAMGADKKGLFVYPYFFGGVSITDDLNPDWQFELVGDTDIGSGFGLGIRPPAKLNVTADLSTSWDTTNLKLTLTVTRKQAGEKIYLFGNPDSTHLSLAGLVIKAFVEKENTARKDFGVDLKLQKLRLEIKKGDGDGFLNKIIPESGINIEYDLQLGYSLEKGFYFKGSGSLGIEIPLHLTLGPLDINKITLGFRPENKGLGLDLGGTFKLKLGPITGLVENIGLSNLLTFPEGDSTSFSLADIKAGFKPPNGVGINIDLDAVKGGGYLYINREEGRYAGVAGLSIKEKIQLAAFGLISTKLPSGNKGYSFLIFISAEFPAIQLGFGFTLNGVGGIVGIHRTMVVDKLREGVKTGAYDRLLFPANPVEDALEIISDLQAIFPVEEGRYTFGIMAKIGWGTPTLITAEMGLLIEVPSPVRLVILGVIKATLPDEQGKILKLQVNFLGVIDFGKKQLSFDASLFDSRLLTFTLAGDMALRLTWGNNANFLLSVGGFHPSFQPPPGLTGMKRLTLNLLGGDNPRLTLTSYFAVTSNTVQFGAKAEVYVKITKNISADGYLSFDALFQFNPFYMHLLAAAYMSVKWKGDEKLSVTVNISLEGPTPWKVDGEAEIKICGIEAKVRVQKTWGQSQNTTLATVSVSGKLEAALSDLRNWEGILPRSVQQVVRLRELAEGEKVLHPAGQLRISQKVLPLNLDIQLFGAQEVSDGRQYKLGSVKIGSKTLTALNYVKEDFVPAHFRKMSETQKLSSPSFVKFDGGVLVADPENLDGKGFASKDIQYETIIFDPVSGTAGSGAPMDEDEDVLIAMVRGGAAGQSGLSFSPRVAPLAPAEITVLEEYYGVVRIEDLQLYDPDALKPSFAEAVDHYAAIVRGEPGQKTKLKILPKFEILL